MLQTIKRTNFKCFALDFMLNELHYHQMWPRYEWGLLMFHHMERMKQVSYTFTSEFFVYYLTLG